MTTRKRAIGIFALSALAALAVILAAVDAPAQAPSAAKAIDPMSPVGIWTTIDDATGKPKSLIRIWEKGGKIYGTIAKLINPKNGDPNPMCDKCPGALKDKPVVGMTIMKGLSRDGDEWSGGTILDPESGSTYKVYVEVLEGGKKLKVRGYVGIALLGRTQYWIRAK
jgi:uncharacterized protein (DUF2147 family)